MGMVKRKIRLSSAVNLYNMISEGKGKGTTAHHDLKRVRKALEACTTYPDCRPAFLKDEETERNYFGVDPNLPVFRCPKCSEGIIIMHKDTKEFEACSKCKWKTDKDDPFDPDWDEVGGYDRLKDEKKKNVKYLFIELPKRFIAGTIWTRILLPKLEGEHIVADEDVIERICDEFAEDGLPQQFQNVTTKEEKDEEEKADGPPPPQLVSDKAAEAVKEKMLQEAEETDAADREQPAAETVGKS